MTSQEVASGYVTIIPTTKGFAKGIEGELGGSFDAAEKKGSGLFGGMFKRVVGFASVAAAGIGAAFSAKKVFGGGLARLMSIEDAQAKLKGLGNDAGAVSDIMANALSAVRGTAFGMGEAATTAAGAVAAGIKPGTELEGVLKSVANSAAAAGVGMDEMGSIYNKVASLGKAQNDVLQQVADRGIPIYQALADQFGVTTDEVFKMASAGKIGFADFQQAMTTAAGTVADEVGGTLRGSLMNMGSALGRIGANLLGGVFPLFAPAIQGITKALGPVEDAAKRVGDAFGAWATGTAIPAIKGLIDLFRGDFTPALREALGWEEDSGAVDAILSIRAVAGGLMDTLRGIVAVVRDGDFNGSLFAWLGVQEDSPFVDLLFRVRDALAGIGPEVSGGITAMFAAFKEGGDDITSSGLAGFLESIGLAARNFIDPLSAAFAGLWEAIAPVLPQVMEAVGAFNPLGLIFKALVPILPQVGALLGELVATLAGALGPVVGTLVPVLAQVAQIIIGALSTAFASLLPVITQLLPVITTLVGIVGETLLTVVQALAPVLVTLVSAFLQILPAVMSLVAPLLGIVTALLPLVAIVGQLIGSLLPPLLSIFMAILEPVLALIAPLVSALAPVLQLIGDIIGAVVVPIIGVLAGWLVKLVAFLAPVIAALAGGLVGAITGVIKGVGNLVGSIATFVSDSIGKVSSFASSVGDTLGRVGGFFRDLPATILGVFANAGTWLIDSGRKIIDGLVDGIKDVGKKVGDAIGGVLASARELLPFSPAKRGPFSGKGWTLYSGRSIVGALAEGVLDERATLERATTAVLAGAQAQISGASIDANVTGALAKVPGSSAAAGGVYVQNPFTGEYLLAQVDERASGVLAAEQRSAAGMPREAGRLR
ncbi:tape measure protein [Cellulomonas iranensis]|uniref:tape measure protein n=1 Tax=Cellulomonas iranensis TaxID=76862 RepID=UPI0013D4EF54|nr:tape measure protein [Cellulomonas iranensis]